MNNITPTNCVKQQFANMAPIKESPSHVLGTRADLAGGLTPRANRNRNRAKISLSSLQPNTTNLRTVVLVYAPPGTGKTSYINQLRRRWPLLSIHDTDDGVTGQHDLTFTNMPTLLPMFNSIKLDYERKQWDKFCQSKCSNWQASWFDDQKAILPTGMLVRARSYVSVELRDILEGYLADSGINMSCDMDDVYTKTMKTIANTGNMNAALKLAKNMLNTAKTCYNPSLVREILAKRENLLCSVFGGIVDAASVATHADHLLKQNHYRNTSIQLKIHAQAQQVADNTKPVVYDIPNQQSLLRDTKICAIQPKLVTTTKHKRDGDSVAVTVEKQAIVSSVTRQAIDTLVEEKSSMGTCGGIQPHCHSNSQRPRKPLVISKLPASGQPPEDGTGVHVASQCDIAAVSSVAIQTDTHSPHQSAPPLALRQRRTIVERVVRESAIDRYGLNPCLRCLSWLILSLVIAIIAMVIALRLL